MTNLDNILKTIDITLRTKVRLVRAKVSPVVTCALKNKQTNKQTNKQKTQDHMASQENSIKHLEIS